MATHQETMSNIHMLLTRYLTAECYIELFTNQGILQDYIPHVWERGTSSTGKYHQRENGEIDSIADHTYEMMYAAVKTFKLFGSSRVGGLDEDSLGLNSIVLSLYLHDITKYGEDGKLVHTSKTHDKESGLFVMKHKEVLSKHTLFEKLYDSVRFHSGRWSTDFDVSKFSNMPFFIHTLDMLSTYNCLTTYKLDPEVLFKNYPHKLKLYTEFLEQTQNGGPIVNS